VQHVVPDVPSSMWTLEIIVTHPGPQDVIELRGAKADEEIQTFALDGADERFRECIGVGRFVGDLDDPGAFRCPDGLEAGAELGVGVADQETRRDPLFGAPHQGVAGLLGHPRCVRGIGRSAAMDAAAAKMDEHQHIGRPWPMQRKHGLGEEIAGDHGVHMRPDERGPWQSRLLLAALRARVDARLVQDAFDGIRTGMEPQLFQLARDPLVAPKEVFRTNADDDVAQFLRQARPADGLERGPDTHLGEPALVGGRLGHLKEPVDLVPALGPNANEFGFLGGRQDNSLRRDAGPQDRDLGLQQPQLCVVARHEELVQMLSLSVV